MNCIFLSPHFPPQYHRFCRQLKLAGANALGIGDAPYDTLAPEVREALSEYYRVERMDDYDQLLRACGHFTHRYGKIDRIDSLNEYWLGIEARLRDDFNVFGVRTADIGTIRPGDRADLAQWPNGPATDDPWAHVPHIGPHLGKDTSSP